MKREEIGPRVLIAEGVSYRDTYKRYVGSKVPPMLNTEEDALAVFVAMKAKGVTTELDKIMTKLPEGIRKHFKAAQEMKTERGPFFTRFALLVKSPEDGMLRGIGADEEYYVLATWDREGYNHWLPKRDAFGRPVIG